MTSKAHPGISLTDAVRGDGGMGRMWTTPTGSDAKNHAGPAQHRRKGESLNVQVGGALNPRWVSWLMGWPCCIEWDWTDLNPPPPWVIGMWLERVQGGIWWREEPAIPRVIGDLPHRAKRLTGLGNGVVPAVMVAAWNLLKGGIDGNQAHLPG